MTDMTGHFKNTENSGHLTEPGTTIENVATTSETQRQRTCALIPGTS